MPWLMVYVTVAVVVLSVVGAWCAKDVRRDPGRVLAIITAAALWPVLVVGLAQFGVIHLVAAHLRRNAQEPAVAAPAEPEPATAPIVLVGSRVRMA